MENGVDLVLELPFIFACSRAEVFASGAIDNFDWYRSYSYIFWK